MAYAHEVEDTLQAPDYALFLHHLYGNEPSYWDDNLPKQERLRFILNCFTRMRFCEKPLTTQPHHPPILQLHAKGAPEQHPEYIPWFDMPHRVMRHENILFGHWSALETNQHCKTPHLFPLDSGCVWGNALTAYCLNTQEYTRIPCKPYLTSQHSRRL
jgi:bis(5'-nucleosyl)-tetraphosphatase (symmetrical)